MGKRLEKIKNKRGPGRPKIANPKRHLPKVTIYDNTVEEMAQIAEKKGRNLSEIYQEALDLYLRSEKTKNIIVHL